MSQSRIGSHTSRAMQRGRRTKCRGVNHQQQGRKGQVNVKLSNKSRDCGTKNHEPGVDTLVMSRSSMSAEMANRSFQSVHVQDRRVGYDAQKPSTSPFHIMQLFRPSPKESGFKEFPRRRLSSQLQAGDRAVGAARDSEAISG